MSTLDDVFTELLNDETKNKESDSPMTFDFQSSDSNLIETFEEGIRNPKEEIFTTDDLNTNIHT